MAVVEGFHFSWWGILLPPIFTVVGFPFLVLSFCGEPSSKVPFVFGVVVGWLYYLLLTIWSLRAKSRKSFIRVFIVLCISLILNVAGCEALKHSTWKTEIQSPDHTMQRMRASHSVHPGTSDPFPWSLSPLKPSRFRSTTATPQRGIQTARFTMLWRFPLVFDSL
jgi:hypothetical protein